MKVKIDTKEKMHVIMLEEPEIAANMTEEVREVLLPFLNQTIKNVVINFEEVKRIDGVAAESFFNIQQKFYEANCSMVFCNLQPEVEAFLEEEDLLEMMNVTPTESEAWDIVQMEEIERELL